MKVCNNCKTIALKVWVYCPKCGQKLEKITQKEFLRRCDRGFENE